MVFRWTFNLKVFLLHKVLLSVYNRDDSHGRLVPTRYSGEWWI